MSPVWVCLLVGRPAPPAPWPLVLLCLASLATLAARSCLLVVSLLQPGPHLLAASLLQLLPPAPPPLASCSHLAMVQQGGAGVEVTRATCRCQEVTRATCRCSPGARPAPSTSHTPPAPGQATPSSGEVVVV